MRWKLYIWSIMAIILLSFLDLYITYLYTPDLRSEFKETLGFQRIFVYAYHHNYQLFSNCK